MSTCDETNGCGGKQRTSDCPSCRDKRELIYWCEVCGRVIGEKRCPVCGLKGRKIRPDCGG